MAIGRRPARRETLLIGFGIGAGVLLAVIGVRFLLVPEMAQRSFGLDRVLKGSELHHVIGLRDLWLAGLALILAAWREWRALAAWLLLGALVCFGDGLIVLMSSGKAWAVAFHWGCGIACLALGTASLGLARRAAEAGAGGLD